MRLLLDKVTVRHILTGFLQLAETRGLTDDEMIALNLYERAGSRALQQFMTPCTEPVESFVSYILKHSASNAFHQA